jgi:hypothetical protein
MPFNSSQALQSRIMNRKESLSWLAASADLFDAVQMETQNDAQITDMIKDLEVNAKPALDDVPDRFMPLIGLYDVSYIKTTTPRDNPVGGKWTRKNGIAQKILNTRRTFQHILPANTTTTRCRSDAVGEAVNVVSLEAFWGLLRVTVILRGDAIPLTIEERTNTSRVVQTLSPLAVKALFDHPRIILGKRGRLFNIHVGPSTSVLLDTTYCDDKVRIGMGGTSGTRFVFVRCADDDVEANEFRGLLDRKPMQKKKALVVLGTTALTGLYVAIGRGLRVSGGILGMASFVATILIATSSGGIEDDDRSVQFRKEEDAVATVTVPVPSL